MKLYYYKDPRGNFGDDLNPWLWSRLLPDVLDGDDSTLFVGIGTLLNHRLPDAPVKHIFGSGYGYGELPRIDGRFVFHAVRGYGTARMLGLSEKTVVTDAAVLLKTVAFERAPAARHRIGFIPHCQSSRYFDWESVCAELGFKYISAEWDVDTVLREMTSCEALVCEAMHGAIAADTLRIPWIPVSCYDYISSFKWEDWLSTLELPYAPARITSLYDIERSFSPGLKIKNHVKRGLRAVGAWSPNWTPPPRRKTGREEFDRAADELRVAVRGPQYLSRDEVLDAHVYRYLELLDSMKRGN
ncbi:polysaccharide pyruvyl transferase family protein [Aromatoleum sp.]|uniref:polysaccharide pyruvyl transferase family protein n=1 Tax=Aromatoleum sp. TaxID=2307007 RepID=UPI002FC6C690